MNKRKFISTLFTGLILVPQLPDHFKWKRSVKSDLWLPNPAYINAPYEVAFWGYPDFMHTFIFNRKHFNGYQPIIFKKGTTEIIDFKIIKYPVRLDAQGNVISPMIHET